MQHCAKENIILFSQSMVAYKNLTETNHESAKSCIVLNNNALDVNSSNYISQWTFFTNHIFGEIDFCSHLVFLQMKDLRLPKAYHDNNKSVGCRLWSNMGTCRSAKHKINCQFFSSNVIAEYSKYMCWKYITWIACF
jgi:hypothetical protein